METKFPRDIKLKDSWFQYDYDKFTQTLGKYNTARWELENLEYDNNTPIPCKTWTKCYIYGDEPRKTWTKCYLYGHEPRNLAKMWTEINDYIEEHEKKDGWTFSHICEEEVDVNTDPYCDYENLTEAYTVYAIVKKDEDFRQSEQYLTQEAVVQQLYDEVMELKQRIDERLGG